MNTLNIRLLLSSLSLLSLGGAFYITLQHGGGVEGCITYVEIQLPRLTMLAFLSLAMATVISVGQVDISAGAVMSIFGTLTIYVSHLSSGNISLHWLPVLFFPLFLATYAIYSFAICQIPQLNTLILTLAASIALRGVSEFVQLGTQNIGPLTKLLNPSNQPGLLQTPLPAQWLNNIIYLNSYLHLFFLIVALVGLYFWRYHTLSGLRHLALGESRQSAVRAGIKREPVLITAFAIAGSLVFFAWLTEFFAIRGTSWTIKDARGYEFIAIAAAVIGGTRIEGGRFDPIAVVFAACFVTLVEGMVRTSKFESETSYLITGFALATAAIFNGLSRSASDGQITTSIDKRNQHSTKS